MRMHLSSCTSAPEAALNNSCVVANDKPLCVCPESTGSIINGQVDIRSSPQSRSTVIRGKRRIQAVYRHI